MDLTLTTPSLLFPAISLLLLAYTNRFVVLTNVIRELSKLNTKGSIDASVRQIKNLQNRLNVIRAMQSLGVLSFVVCTLSMLALYLGFSFLGGLLFAGSLALLVISLLFSLYEVHVSTKAISIEIQTFYESIKALSSADGETSAARDRRKRKS